VFYEKHGVLVDSSFFDVFPFQLKEGDANTALDAPSTVVISEVMSTKIFGDKSPLDELLIINSGRSSDTFRITGVVKKTPERSHVTADFYMCMNSNGWGRWILNEDTWAWNNFMGSYIKLKPGTTPQSVEEKLPAMLEQRAGALLKNAGMEKSLHLQPLDDVRLYSNFKSSFGDGQPGGIKNIYILGSIGVFILLLACINFMNLTTAKAAQRAIQRDAEDPWTHFAAGYVHMVSRGFEAAVAELSEAIALNPSFAFAHMILGSTYGYGGQPEDGLHHLNLAARLSPRDFTQSANFASCGLCHFIGRRFAEAAEYERRAVELRPNFGTAWRTYAASAGMAGDTTTARKALTAAKRLHPSLSAEWVERFHPIVRPTDRAIYIEGLRIAGLD
jgi:tetratricopeptide (TPR) repeat protein